MQCEAVQYEQGVCVSVGAHNVRQLMHHWHDTDLEIVFVMEGKVNVSAVYDDFEVSAGEFVVINREDIHYIHGDGDNIVFLIHMDLLHLQGKYEHILFFDLMCESFKTNIVQVEHVKKLKKLFIKIILEVSKGEKKSVTKLNSYTDEAIEIMINHFDIAHYYNDKPIQEYQLQRYYRIMRNIGQRYDEKINMETIAQEEYIGKNYMSQFWKKMIGINFTDYLNSRRTEVAQKLLLTTDLSLQEISLKCGFSDTKYLYKNFKKWYLSTPHEHRKKYILLKAKGGEYGEYFAPEIIAEKFGGQLINYLVGVEGILEPSKDIESWRQAFERAISFPGRRIKREMMKENQKAMGIREIFLPLLDRHVVQRIEDEFVLDFGFISEVVQYVKEMNCSICVDIHYPDRKASEWYEIIRKLVSFVLNTMGRESLVRFKFYIFVTEMHLDGDVEELVNRLGEVIDVKHIKVLLRYK